jgi:hypothetical protein
MEQVKLLTNDLKDNANVSKRAANAGTDKRKRKRLLRRITYKKFRKTYTEENFKEVFDVFVGL